MEGDSQYNTVTLTADLLRIVLKIGNENEESKNVMQILDSLIKENPFQEVIDLRNDIILMLLRDRCKEIVAQTAKDIADMTKTDKGRKQCTNIDIIETLMELLKEDNISILIQTSRALGNICYENKNGKVMIKKKDGLKYILQMLKRATDLKDTENADMLRRVASGLLLNFLEDQESLLQQALEENIVQVLCNILEIDGATAGETITHVLLTLGVLSEAQVTFLDKKLINVIANILSNSTSLKISEMCLELLYYESDDEEVKLLFTKANIPELLLKFIETYTQYTIEETGSVLTVAVSLIVSILTGDNSMNILYDNGKGTVYNNLVKWLDSNDENLHGTAVLAMGNFARTYTHCKLMVEQDIHKKLLQLLQQNYSTNTSIKFHLLSALHNLLIPADNKPIILKDGLIDILYPMLDISSFSMVFQLLGTLRIVIDGQKEAAISLGKKEDLIKRVVVWCGTDNHPGVQCEARRLLAWLINNSKDKGVALVIIKYDGTQYLIKMILAKYALMQNEAILSLTYLATICPIELKDALVENNIGHVIFKFFKESASNLELPIICNMCSFIDSIIKLDIIKQHLNNTGLKTALKNVLDYKNIDSNLKDKINSISNIIDVDTSLN